MQKDAEPSNPPKRQRSSPKPRETEFLNLKPPLDLSNQSRQLATLRKLLHKKKKIVVIAGAGISVGAGIPDFRSSNGLFNTLRSAKNSGRDLFDASVYKDNDLTSSFHDMVRMLHSMASTAEPTDFHQLLAALASEGRLLRLYSQNVDCIETQLEPLQTTVPLQNKGPWPKTIQLHGGLNKMTCSKCAWVGTFEPELFVGAEPPDCKQCLEFESVRGVCGKRSLGVGKLRPRIVLYNEFHPDADAIGAVTEADIRARPDAVIVVGTSLKVPGVKRIVQEMCKSVRGYRGGLSAWINMDEPPNAKDYSFDLIVQGGCEQVAELAKAPSPTDSDSESSEGSFVELDPNEPARNSALIQVQIPHLPSPSLSPVPREDSTTAKPRKRTAAVAKLEEELPAKRTRTRTAKKIEASTPLPPPAKKKLTTVAVKRQAKKPATIKGAFKSVKTGPASSGKAKTKAHVAKKAAKQSPVPASEPPSLPSPATELLGESDPVSSAPSPVSSSIPSPVRSVCSIPVSSLLN